jgi:two-component system sensor histidine kinase AlgZ
MKAHSGTAEERHGLLLPDFCAGPPILAVIACAEIFALLMQLLQAGEPQSLRLSFGSSSLFLLWVGLGSAGLLCALRSALVRLRFGLALTLALLVLLGVVAIVSGLAILLSTSQSLPMPEALQIPPPRLHFLLRNLLIAALAGALALPYAYIARRWQRRALRQAQIDLAALKLKLKPRVLLQSVQDLAELVREGGAGAMARDLATLMSANLEEQLAPIRLGTEVEIARCYQRLRQLHLGERLHVMWDIPDLPLGALAPPQLLQTLLHLAIAQGIEPRGGGIVTLSGAIEQGFIGLSVRYPLSELAAANGSVTILDLLREQLSALWPGQSQIDAERSGDEMCVRARWPLLEPP